MHFRKASPLGLVSMLSSPTVTDQMAHYVAPVAFGRTWTIMLKLLSWTLRLGHIVFISSSPCHVALASEEREFVDSPSNCRCLRVYSLDYILTVRDLVSKDKMIWCGEVGGVEADLSVSMPLYSQFEGTGSSVDTAKGSAEAGCSSSSLSSSSFSTSLSSLSSSDDSLS
ncbi:hypothetical protein Tco_1345138 [Tanacetum coccineum]